MYQKIFDRIAAYLLLAEDSLLQIDLMMAGGSGPASTSTAAADVALPLYALWTRRPPDCETCARIAANELTPEALRTLGLRHPPNAHTLRHRRKTLAERGMGGNQVDLSLVQIVMNLITSPSAAPPVTDEYFTVLDTTYLRAHCKNRGCLLLATSEEEARAQIGEDPPDLYDLNENPNGPEIWDLGQPNPLLNRASSDDLLRTFRRLANGLLQTRCSCDPHATWRVIQRGGQRVALLGYGLLVVLRYEPGIKFLQVERVMLLQAHVNETPIATRLVLDLADDRPLGPVLADRLFTNSPELFQQPIARRGAYVLVDPKKTDHKIFTPQEGYLEGLQVYLGLIYPTNARLKKLIRPAPHEGKPAMRRWSDAVDEQQRLAYPSNGIPSPTGGRFNSPASDKRRDRLGSYGVWCRVEQGEPAPASWKGLECKKAHKVGAGCGISDVTVNHTMPEFRRTWCWPPIHSEAHRKIFGHRTAIERSFREDKGPFTGLVIPAFTPVRTLPQYAFLLAVLLVYRNLRHQQLLEERLSGPPKRLISRQPRPKATPQLEVMTSAREESKRYRAEAVRFVTGDQLTEDTSPDDDD